MKTLMRYLFAMVALSIPVYAHAWSYDPDKYYIDYLTATEKDKSLIVYENIRTGKVTKILVKTEALKDPKAIDAIKQKVAEENP